MTVSNSYLMDSPAEVFTSSRGYQIGINNTKKILLAGWIEISCGREPIKKPFQAICLKPNSHSINFCTFIHWNPYFNGITSVISGLCTEDQILIDWVVMTSSGQKNNMVISQGTDNLINSDLKTTSASFISTEVPHPFHLGMLNLSTDLTGIETFHTHSGYKI